MNTNGINAKVFMVEWPNIYMFATGTETSTNPGLQKKKLKYYIIKFIEYRTIKFLTKTNELFQ